MELYEMTFKQFCENWLEENSKYKAKYLEKPALWEYHKKMSLYSQWEKILLERAEVGPIPSDVLMSFIRRNGEGLLFRMFRGRYEKGIQNFKIPKSIRDLREAN